ncbi:hypothetical protein HDV00_002149 [Rhizophlyctis rosea]|nr:hypothetical protein HDV00_002149 [Rhizophlyctis rosea]
MEDYYGGDYLIGSKPDVLLTLGFVNVDQKDYDSAEPLLMRILANGGWLSQPKLRVAMRGLAVVHQHPTKHPETKRWRQESLEYGKQMFGENDPDTLYYMLHVADLQSQKEYQEAEAFLTDTIQRARRKFGDGDEWTPYVLSHLSDMDEYSVNRKKGRRDIDFVDSIFGNDAVDHLETKEIREELVRLRIVLQAGVERKRRRERHKQKSGCFVQ